MTVGDPNHWTIREFPSFHHFRASRYGQEPPAEPLRLTVELQTPICPNGQMHLPEQADASAQTGEPLPCSYHVATTPPIVPPRGEGVPRRKRRENKEPKQAPDHEPERFAGFWAMYPRGESKQKAIEAWDKLHPSSELIDTIARALKRQVASEAWQQGVGIPYAVTYLTQRRWEDEVKSPARSEPARTVVETQEVEEW